MEFYLDEIESCECISSFNDEYVYDIEIDDETHTFIGNDILVHNSVYATFDPVLKSCDWKGDPVDLVLQIQKYRLSKYLTKKFEEYAKKFNTENIQELEMEKISHSALMVAKKKYILDFAWKDPGIYYKSLEKVKPVGIELVQGSTPKFARKILKSLLNHILDRSKPFVYSEIIKQLKEYKKEFFLQQPDDIAKTVSMSDYEKYVLEDKAKITIADGCPIHSRAAAVYNNKLLNSKYRTKYNLIKSGDKLKYYYALGGESNEVFGFLPYNYPNEFALPINYEMQFEKIIIEPFNKFIIALGYSAIPGNLIRSKSLF